MALAVRLGLRWVTKEDGRILDIFSSLQTLGIIASIAFAGVGLFLDARVRKVDLMLRITQHHREIWAQMFEVPGLSRVLDADADVSCGVKPEHEVFITLVILHLAAVEKAVWSGILDQIPGVDQDVRQFFSLPIPRTVWKKVKVLQEPRLVGYVDGLLAK